MTSVRVNMKATVNLGNFNNFTVEYGVETAPGAGETAPEALARCERLVEKVLDAKVKEARSWGVD